MRTLPLLALVGLLLALPSTAQSITTLSGGVGYHPVTSNGRVVWTEGDTPATLSLHLWDGRNTIVLDENVAGALPGWPDLDASGRVAYVKVIGGRYELMLWDGRETTQLTNSDIPGSALDLGSPASRLKGGFPRVAIGDVVFADAQGHVYLYDGTDQRIRKLTTRDNQRVAPTTQDFRAIMQQTGIKPVFYYDGRYLVWMHRASAGDTSEFTVYQADAQQNYAPDTLGTFTAATPTGDSINAIAAGAAFDPFFVACGPEAAWMFRPPGAVDADVPLQYAGLVAAANSETVLVYHNGTSAREVARGDLLALTLDLSDGNLVWVQREEVGDVERTRIQSHRGGRTSTVATYDPPPTDAASGSKTWARPYGVMVAGNEVLWFAEEVECRKMGIELPGIGDPCIYEPGQRAGLFRRSSGPNAPRLQAARDMLMAAGSLAAGRYAWRSFDSRVQTAVFIPGLTGEDGGVLQLTDLVRPDRIPLEADEPRAKRVDGFSLRAVAGSGECTPGGSGDDATVTALTFAVAAEAGILPDLSDIVALRLHHDVNQNRQIDAGDVLLGTATTPGARTTITLDEPLQILAGDEAHMLVELELKPADELCPCNEYTVALAATDVAAGEATVSGSSTGTLVLPNATIETVWGDVQAALPTTRLEDPLGFRLEGVPARCVENARVRLKDGVPGDTAVLEADGETGTDLEVDLAETDDGLEAEVNLTLGEREGPYYVEATVDYAGEDACAPPSYTFVAHAGTFVLQVVDANDPALYDAAPDNSHADYDAWSVTLSDDLNRFAGSGETRRGTTADGLSPLVLRARLLGINEIPEGEVTFTMSADGDSGFLTPGLGETVPAESGSLTISAEWTMTEAGPLAVALYTPPRQLTPSGATERVVTFTATYQMPGASEASEEEETILVYRPPVLLMHGMWSGPEAWGSLYTGTDGRFEVFTADYASRSAENFDALTEVARDEIQRVRDDLHGRSIAVTQVNVVAHSMGGLLTRKYVSENRGAGFRRPDTFGQGDIYALVTIGTPHNGSPIAWLTLTVIDPQYNRLFAYEFEDAINAAGMDIYSGAVESLCPGSVSLRNLEETHVPAHTVRAWHYDSQTSNDGWDSFFAYFDGILDTIVEGAATGQLPTPMLLPKYAAEFGAELVLEAGVQALYGSQKTDYLVTLESQGGNITQGHAFVFDETLHSHVSGWADGETVSGEIAAYVFTLLTNSPDDISTFARSIPPPIVETDYITCQ
ncbi:MAG: hypothetical protein AAF624_10270 [Bacteroidota bacterium]